MIYSCSQFCQCFRHIVLHSTQIGVPREATFSRWRGWDGKSEKPSPLYLGLWRGLLPGRCEFPSQAFSFYMVLDHQWPLPSPSPEAGWPRVHYSMTAGFQNSKNRSCVAVAQNWHSSTCAIKPVSESPPHSQSGVGKRKQIPPLDGKSGICIRNGKDALSAIFGEYQPH